MLISYFTEGFKIFSRKLRIAFFGLKRYEGDEKQILKKIVDECWNGNFFQVSNGNFKSFYIRDFGICIDDLIALGYRKECIKTMEFAIDCYKRDNRITTTITMSHRTVDFFSEAIDSFAFLCYCIKAVDDKKLTKESKKFIESQAMHHFSNSIDKRIGLIRKDKSFSSIKDHGVRNSSCYDNCMIAMASDCLDSLGYKNPFKKYDYKKLIIQNFWNGRYFYEDLNQKEVVTGDANVFPFWCKVVVDKGIFKKAFSSIKKIGLDKPLPLCYSRNPHSTKLGFMDLVAPNYEGNTAWLHLGLCFVDVVDLYDPNSAKVYVKAYMKKIKEYKNFLEVFDKKGTPFKTFFYYCDDGLIWAAKLLRKTTKRKE